MRIDNPVKIDVGSLESAATDPFFVIQFSRRSAYGPEILRELDDACKVLGARLEVRFYGHYDDAFDCHTLSSLPSVRFLALDRLRHLTHLELLGGMEQIESLSFGVFELKSPALLKFENVRRLRRLRLDDNRGNDVDLADLCHFSQLEELAIAGHRRNIDVLGELDGIAELGLRGIPKIVNLDFVSTMIGLKRLSIILGGRTTLGKIRHAALQHLELIRVRGLSNIEPGDFPALTNLSIEDQVQLRQLDVGINRELKQLRIINCKSLNGLAGLDKLDRLETLILSRTSLDPAEIMNQKLSKSLRTMGLSGYGARRDREIETQLRSVGYRNPGYSALTS